MAKLAIDGGTPVRTKPFSPWPIFGELEEQLVLQAVRSGKWGGVGTTVSDEYQPMLPQIEKKFAEYQNARYGVSVANGTVAITSALQAAEVRPGDEVIVPAYTFIASATAGLSYGVIPVFVDIEEDTLLIDPTKIEQAITPRTKAIIAVHIAGAPANMTEIKKIAEKYNLIVIEDAAQAVGAEWEGKKVGALGHLGTFSFQSSKNLNCGEGGMVITNDEELWRRCWSVSNLGRSPGGKFYQHDYIGQNYRMTELQAALLLAQMTHLEEQMKRREASVERLNRLLQEIDGIRLLSYDARITRHANHIYMFKLDASITDKVAKDDFIKKLNAEGIPAQAGYIPLNQNTAIQAAIEQWSGRKMINDCPVCERLCEKEVVWLPQRVLLSDEEAIHDVATAIDKVLRSY